MSEVSEDRGCGRATMYVITEKGLEMGPFMYGKETDSRVLCTNTGHIYYSRRKDGHSGTDTRELEDKRRLRIIDLGNSLLPLENTILGGSKSGRLVFRDHMRENSGFSGKFRTNRGLRRSGKERANNSDEVKREHSEMHLGILKQVLDPTCLRDAERNTVENNDKNERMIKREDEQHTMRSRQTELRELQLKRKSKDLLEELARWKERYYLASHRKDVGKDREVEKSENKMYSSRMKTGDRNVLPCLNLSSSLSKRVNITESSRNDTGNKPMMSNESSTPRRIRSKKDSKLIFLNPNSQYSQEKAETTAKLNINESKFTSEKPKVRFPSVIDQRTGVMHSVPGVVTYRPCDYNRWSRKNNIVRRSVVHSRSPLMTYVSIFPSIPEK